MISVDNLLEKTKNYLEKVNKQPKIHRMSPNEVRILRAVTSNVKNKTLNSLQKIDDLYITVRDGERIPIRIYTPQGEGPFPIVIYYHGGGWVLNTIDTCDTSCQLIASITNRIVVSVGYRLAPEWKFPVPLYDAYDALLWVEEQASLINGQRDQLIVMGDSAGGNLATILPLLSKELNGPRISAQVLLYPVTDLNFNTKSYIEFAEGYGLEKKDMEWFANHYVTCDEEKNHPYIAPLKAKDLSQLPPAFIIVAENDVLRDEGIAYGNLLTEWGNNVELHIAKGLVHSYFTKNDIFHLEIKETIEQVKSFLDR